MISRESLTGNRLAVYDERGSAAYDECVDRDVRPTLRAEDRDRDGVLACRREPPAEEELVRVEARRVEVDDPGRPAVDRHAGLATRGARRPVPRHSRSSSP